MQLKSSSFRSTYFYAILIGTVVGFLGGNAFRLIKSGCFATTPLSQWLYGDEVQSQVGKLKHNTDKNLVLIGVLATPNFLASRIVAANNTWVKDIPGKVVIFISEGSTIDANISGIEIAELPGIGGNKFARVLKYMHDHYLNKYVFLMIIDDDLFIRADQMIAFLHSLPPNQLRSREKLNGRQQKTHGTQKTGHKFDEYYCIGYNAMFVPRVSLARVGRNSRRCARKALTVDEDVEFERCWMRRFANATCKRFDQDIFAHKYRNVNLSFADSLDDKVIGDSIVLQNVETSQSAYTLHHHFLVAKKSSIRRRLQSLKRDSNAMEALLSPWKRTPRFLDDLKINLSASSGRSADDTNPWFYFAGFKGSPFIFNPHIRPRRDERQAADKIAKEIAIISKKASVRGQAGVPDFDHLYTRANILYGLEYILKSRKRVKTPRYSQISLYARRPYLPVEMMDEFRHLDSLNIHQNGQVDYLDQKQVKIIISLTGRYPIFLRFMKNFEDRLLKTKQSVSLLIVLYRNYPNDTSANVIDYIERLQRNYSDVTLSCKLMEGAFSRGRAFQAAVQGFRDDDLMFFADIDLVLEMATIQRIRLNTKRGESVYAPMFFGEYNPHALPHSRSSPATTYYDSDIGCWRMYSFGMVSCYKSDFIRTGGYRVDIEGWGLEDLELTDKIIALNITMFRSVDVEMVHKFHAITCANDLQKIQLDMCIGTKANALASPETMAEFIYKTSSILNRSN